MEEFLLLIIFMNQFHNIYFVLFNISFHVSELEILIIIRLIVVLEFPDVDLNFNPSSKLPGS